jgi:hypothetical protein
MAKRKNPLRAPPSEEKVLESEKALKKALLKADPVASALLGGAAIENALMFLLDRFLVACEESKGLFDLEDICGSASKCNRLALCLGLIQRASFENNKKIAKIRNRFAHHHVPVDFDDKEIVGLCSGLTLEENPRSAPLKGNGAQIRFSNVVAREWERLYSSAFHTVNRKEFQFVEVVPVGAAPKA